MILYAHRGAAAERPENTLPSFARALESGADALEMDVHATRDGTLVVSHDPDGARMCNVQRAFRDADWDEVSRWDAGWGFQAPNGARPFAGKGIGVPRLLDVVRAFPGVLLNVDLKVPVADAAVSLLRSEQAEARVCLASFQSSTLRRVRALGYAGPTGMAWGEMLQFYAVPAVLQRGPLKPPGTVAQLPLYQARPWIVARCHALGLRVDYWTVNDVPTAQRLLTLGADGVMTDDPGLLAPVLKANPQGDAHG